MKSRLLDFGYPILTVVLTVYGQLIVRWRVGLRGALPGPAAEKLKFLASMLTDVYVLSGFAAAFLAAVCWMAALTKFDLSYVYPITALSFVFVLLLSGLIFKEPITVQKVVGVSLILCGTIVACWK